VLGRGAGHRQNRAGLTGPAPPTIGLPRISSRSS